MIKFNGVTKRFVSGIVGKKTVTALDCVDLEMPSHKIIGVLGENGAGKTTMIKLISGLLLPTGGDVSIDNMNWKHHKKELYKLIGTMLEGGRTTHWPLTVRQNLEYFGILRGVSRCDLKKRVDSSIDFFGLKDKEGVRVQSLSQGMKQKLALAVSMLPEPKYLLLDEPVSGIDYATSLVIQDKLREWVRKNGRTIIITTHDMDVAHKLCDRVVIMRRGKIVADDDLERLVDLFSKKEYIVKFQDAPYDGIEPICLNSQLLESSWDEASATIRLSLDDHNSINDVVYLLAKKYGNIESIRSEKTRLGDIYTKLMYGK